MTLNTMVILQEHLIIMVTVGMIDDDNIMEGHVKLTVMMIMVKALMIIYMMILVMAMMIMVMDMMMSTDHHL